ncbi:tetratricopeptide repeat protein [Rhodalgimonas zhirmunskyi]|uniref:Tetratricopeptide repeat protein n=1 Tax=Rhodalgimonas zhirmunskyi TaxID=2964767 RepID=A0AAJ1U8K6_9RHOB|nr:tetratricopeptide repeat protein [Rhodoalgimonas zhirmunskyi]MDQ2093780.1 tetratricopeptide repeat protein [Rhodoalgimonas zhirmunskyi]
MTAKTPFIALTAALVALVLSGCAPKLDRTDGGPYAPGVKRGGEAVDGLVVGHRLMAAGEYELALSAFTRAAAEQGMTNDIRLALGTANLGLGRLGQAETLLRKAVKEEPTIPEAWNNLGVVLMEKREYAEAAQVFRRAYALDNGESDSVRDNLRKALAKSENPDYADETEQDYKLVRRGSSDFLIRRIP